MKKAQVPPVPPKLQASTSLTASVAIQIRAAILDGTYPPGMRLRLDELRQTYDVSLSPLREALTRLAAEDLVQITDQRGYQVTPVSAENLREVTVLRTQLEITALKESLKRGDEAWEDALVAAYHRLHRLEDGGQRPEGWEKAHRAFHLALVSACDMPLLLRFCGSLHDLSDRYRRLFLTRHAPDANVPGEHQALFEAAIARDDVRAAEILARHLGRTGQNVMMVLTQIA
ncbi:HTH gntR-type domain-containing protein [Bordetella tumbae]|uniref:GntR family transcriptional regulator n=1 Tax=Bordetella tumbae TaxID=1649139 RepID=UPI0039EF34E7